MAFAQTAFAQFIASSGGRLLRVIAGIALIAWGYSMRDSALGVGLIIVGLVPLAAGALDVCLLSPLFGGPFSGKRIRACAKS